MIARSSLIALGMALMTCQAAKAQDAPGESAMSDDVASDIIVTGTRRGDRTATESAVPIDVFNADALRSEGTGDMNNILRTLVPSFNVGQPTRADGSTFVRPPTMRGLPPDEVLVLINGKRRHRSALVQLQGGDLGNGSEGVDLSQIPAIALERIEVLRDGAAAQYGSDAIAGVINYSLRRADHGGSLNLKYGQFYPGDGKNFQADGNIGLKLGDSGFINLSAEYIMANETNRSAQDANAYAVKLARPDLAPLISDRVEILGNPRQRSFHGFVNAGYQVSDDSEVYAFGSYGISHYASSFTYRTPATVTGPSQSGAGTITYNRNIIYNPIYLTRTGATDPATGLPIYDASGATFNFSSVFPGGFVPRFRGEVEDYAITGGYKGKLAFGLNYDLSASLGDNRIAYDISNTVNPSLGQASPTSFYLGELEQRDFNLNLDMSYDWEIGLASPLTIAFGAERRDETYTIRPGDEASYIAGPYAVQVLNTLTPGGANVISTHPVGSSGFPGQSPQISGKLSRVSYAGYLDLEADVTEGFSLGLAGRYEHFDDFGSTLNGKASLRYAFSPKIAVRGAASTGFRAPTPGQAITSSIGTLFQGAVPLETATVAPSSIVGQFYGSKPLTPEKSINLSAGLVFTPSRHLTTTIDYYNIEVRDRLGVSSLKTVLDSDRPKLAALGVENAFTIGQVQYFTNAFRTRTQGIDLVVNHSLETSIGRFSSVLAANYNATKVTRRDVTVINDISKGNIEHLNPKVRGSFTETWKQNGWEVMGRANFYGRYTSYETFANGGNLTLGAEWVFDLEVSKQITDFLRVTAGAQNIFNNYPDRDIRAVGQPNSNYYAVTGGKLSGQKYLPSAPMGYNGGLWYARVGVTF